MDARGNDGFGAAERAVLDDLAEEAARPIPVVIAATGDLVCSQCGDDHVRVAALFRTIDYRRPLVVCTACLKTTSAAASEAGK